MQMLCKLTGAINGRRTAPKAASGESKFRDGQSAMLAFEGTRSTQSPIAKLAALARVSIASFAVTAWTASALTSASLAAALSVNRMMSRQCNSEAQVSSASGTAIASAWVMICRWSFKRQLSTDATDTADAA